MATFYRKEVAPSATGDLLLRKMTRITSYNVCYTKLLRYNLLRSETQRLYVVGEIERLDMDADGITEYPDNNRFFDYTAGIAYYPDAKVVLKADYMVRDYGANAKLADESVVTLAAGFIF